MKRLAYAVATLIFGLAVTFSSCSKIDWKIWKDCDTKFPVVFEDCDVKRVYALDEKGGIDLQMQKTYNREGLIKTIGFYTESAVSSELYWHSYLLNYNASDWSINVVDSASGEVVLKAIFNHSGVLQQLKRMQGETSDYADRSFEYAGGRLSKIYARWKTFDFVESFTYDVNGNIIKRETNDPSGVIEASVFSYGAAATGKKQFYIPQYNYLIVVDPSMTLLEYLRWIKDFSPKNILTGIEYLTPLPHEATYSVQVFDTDGKLTSYSNGDYPGGTKYIDWRCSGL